MIEILAVIIVAVALLLVIYYITFPKYAGEQITERLKEQEEILKSTIDEKTLELVEANEKIQMDLVSVRANVSRLTTEEIQQRLVLAENRLTNLSKQLSSLQQIISPNNAGDILTVARMKEEILARSKFERNVDEKGKSYTRRVEATEKRVEKLQYWIWGTLLTLIGGLTTLVILIGRRLGSILQTLSTNREVGRGQLENKG